MRLLRLQLFFFLFCCFSYQSQAQLAPGTPAPDWTATDLDGNVWDMSDILDSGKHVVLEFSAIWCGPCWNFHNTGTLETLHDLYGPDGTDQIRVFYIEADQNTATNCLYGDPACSNTIGDWVADHEFAFIDLMPGNANNMDNDYNIGYFPTVYAVSANGTNGVYELGQQSNIGIWENWFFESFALQLNSTSGDALCPGEGFIQLSPTGGFGSVEYSWNTGDTGTSLSGLNAGTYTVTATDGNDYFLEETFFIDGPTDGPLEVSLIQSDDVLCNGDANAVLSVMGAGGNGGFTYQWSNGATGPNNTDIPAGVYTVILTDAQGCTEESTYEISQPDVLTLSNIEQDAVCGEETGSVVAISTGGTGPWSYDYGEGFNFTGTFDNVLPGDYVMTVTDENGCTEMTPFSIDAVDGPEVNVEMSEAIDCNTQEVQVSGVGSEEGSNISYTWTTDNGEIVEGADQITATVSAAGTYVLKVTDNTTGCESFDAVIVASNVDAPVTMIADADALTCVVDMIALDATGSSTGDNFTYTWTTDDGNIESGASTESPNVNAAGTYSLLITNTDNGCTSSQDVVVSEDVALPSVSVSDVELDCTTTEMEICADVDAGTTVVWTTQDGEVDATCITVVMAGSYTARATGANGCEDEVVANVTLSADLPQVSIDEPETLTCTMTMVSLDAVLDGDPDSYSISWVSPDGNILNEMDLSISVTEQGTYTLTVQNIENGCSTTSSITVDQVIVNPESSFTTTLDDGVLLVESTSEGDPSDYNWSFGSTDANSEVVFDETGIYEICLTVTNDCGEDVVCEDVYFVSELTYETEVTDLDCFDTDSGRLAVVPSGGEPGYSISWSGPNGFTSTELEISDLATGEYNMVLTDTYGYEKSASYVVDAPEEIIQTLVEITNETNQDENGSITLEAAGGTGALMYEWSNGSVGSTVSGLPAGAYTVSVIDENGCATDFGPFEVESTILSIDDLDLVSEFSIFPIPANNYLNVNITLINPENTQIRIIDAYGKLITTQKFTGKDVKATFDVANYPSGVYYLEFGNNTERMLEKFVVIK